MSVKTLKSFLIGIGYDTKGLDEGEKKISGSLQGLKSRALQLSGALVGAFSAGAASVAATAASVDKLSASTQNLRTSTNAVYNYGNAIRLMGGDANEAFDAIKQFEEIQNNFRLKGETGPLNDLAMAGIDTKSLYSTNTGEEFMRNLADQIPRLNEGQRAQVQSALGLSDATFRALSGGAGQLDNLAKKANQLTGDIDDLTENSRKLLESSSKLGLAIEGVRNELAEKFLPSLIGASNWLNKLIENNREGISKAIDYAAENDGATAALGVSAGASLAGAAASKVGLGLLGGAASTAGTAGVATAAGSLGAHELNQYLDGKFSGYRNTSREFDDWLKSVTGLKTIKSPLQLINEVFAPKVESSDDKNSKASPEQKLIRPEGIKFQPEHEVLWPVESAPLAESTDTGNRHQLDSNAMRFDVMPESGHGDKSDADSVPPQESAPQQYSAPQQESVPQQDNPWSPYREVPPMDMDGLVRRIQNAKINVRNSAYGDRSVADSMPPASAATPEEDRQATADALAGALTRSPIKVSNELGLTIQLDGQALESKITQVNERQNYETLGDLKTTTER